MYDGMILWLSVMRCLNKGNHDRLIIYDVGSHSQSQVW